MKWIDVMDDLPDVGEKVIIFANGVVQEETYIMDAHDLSDYHTEYFWHRGELEECPKIERWQFWMRLPEPPQD